MTKYKPLLHKRWHSICQLISLLIKSKGYIMVRVMTGPYPVSKSKIHGCKGTLSKVFMISFENKSLAGWLWSWELNNQANFHLAGRWSRFVTTNGIRLWMKNALGFRVSVKFMVMVRIMQDWKWVYCTIDTPASVNFPFVTMLWYHCMFIWHNYVTWSREISHLSENSISIFLHHLLKTSKCFILMQTP